MQLSILYIFSQKGGGIMPVFSSDSFRDIDIKILEATGGQLVEIDPEKYLILTIGNNLVAIPKGE